MIQLGEKIRELRKSRDISQETLAEHLGVSFQAVSKWERGETMPDVTLIPAVASYFSVSTDELFGFDVYEVEKKVEAICDEAYQYRGTDNGRSETILRDGLLKYPGNEIILNNLLYVLPLPDRSDDVIDICKKLIEKAKSDEVRLDAIRILGETYYEIGEAKLAGETFEKLPEIYFSKLQSLAMYGMGEDRYRAAAIEQIISYERVIEMAMTLGEIFEEREEKENALAEYEIVMKLLEITAIVPITPWTGKFSQEWVEEYREKMNARIAALTGKENA